MEQKTNSDLWRDRIVAYRSSGLKMKEWCEKNNVTTPALKYWISKFNKQDKTSKATWVAVPLEESTTKNDFTSGITLTIKDIDIKIEQNFNTDTLQRLLQVIQTNA